MTWQWLAPLVVAAAVASVTPRVLLALPAPIDEPDSRPYDALATRAVALTTFLLVGVAGVVVAALSNKLARTTWAVLVKGKPRDQAKWDLDACSGTAGAGCKPLQSCRRYDADMFLQGDFASWSNQQSRSMTCSIR